MRTQRRNFLKVTAVGVAGLTMGRARTVWAAWPSSGTTEINPGISNMRVVACKDPTMMKGTPSSMSFSVENAAVDATRVAADLDAMAMQLANKATAAEAWTTIFRSSNPWPSTRVAIKVNVTEPKNMPRVAVLEKLCRVFAGLGVPAANIVIYDGGPASFATNVSNYTSFFSATDGAKIPGMVSNVSDALGGTTSAPVPNGSPATCTADIANGKVDILVNLAVNKGHTDFGKATLCMKNHFGTFAPNHNDLINYIFNINKSDAILGGTPIRQQLCIVDSLIANKVTNSGTPEAMPYYLVMGTFAPAVDYLTVKKIREEVMNASHVSSVIDSYLTSFGYLTTDPVWVLVPPATTSAVDAGVGGAAGTGSGGKIGSDGPRDDGASGQAGAAGSGGASSRGGASGTGASGGADHGGAPGPGGTQGSGGERSDGAQGHGGEAASTGTGTGGAPGGVGGSSASTSPAPSGGTTGDGKASPGNGCGCDLGAGQPAAFRLAGVTLGAVVGATLWRMLRGPEVSAPKQTPGPGEIEP